MAIAGEPEDGTRRENDDPFWLDPAAFWLPTHYPVSAWTTHAPFAQWLMAALRPTRVVELGTHYGFSCFVFAEAARRLRIPTVIHALDTWQGDDHAGFYGSDVLNYVKEVAEREYAESVSLLRGYFTDSRDLFDDASADLLHVDGRHGYEDVRADYEEWKSTVRDGGIVLFHDIAETENGFGVWKLWQEIAEPGRSFAFVHGHGLGVLAIGDIQPGPLQDLFSADAQTADRVRADFVRLGDVVKRQAWLESLPAELEDVWGEVRRRALHEDQLEARAVGQAEYIEQLRASTSWRVTAPLRALGAVVRRRR